MTFIGVKKTFTLTLSGGENIVFLDSYGYRKVSVSVDNSSSGNITITGTGKLASYTSNAITLKPGDSLTVSDEENSINDLTIAVAAGATGYIVAI